MTKRDAQHAKPTAARTTEATKDPATQATKKKETTAGAAATTRAPTHLKPATKLTEARTTAATEAPAKPAVKEKKTRNAKTTFAQFKRCEAFRREQHAAEAATAAAAETPKMPAA